MARLPPPRLGPGESRRARTQNATGPPEGEGQGGDGSPLGAEGRVATQGRRGGGATIHPGLAWGGVGLWWTNVRGGPTEVHTGVTPPPRRPPFAGCWRAVRAEGMKGRVNAASEGGPLNATLGTTSHEVAEVAKPLFPIFMQ